MRAAAARDIGDWFSFEIGPARPVADGAAHAPAGDRVHRHHGLDVVPRRSRRPGRGHDGEPEPSRRSRVEMPDVDQHGYRAYPLVDHVADKVVATFELHGARRRRRRASGIWSISSRSRSEPPSMRRRSTRRSRPSWSDAGSLCRRASMSLTERYGSRATQRRPDGRCCPWRTRSMTPLRSSRRSSTRCSMGPRLAGGTRPSSAGRPDRLCPTFEGDDPLNV